MNECVHTDSDTYSLIRGRSKHCKLYRLFRGLCLSVTDYHIPDHRAFIRVSRPCNFERTTPPSCVHFGLDISGFGLGPHPGHPSRMSRGIKCQIILISEVDSPNIYSQSELLIKFVDKKIPQSIHEKLV